MNLIKILSFASLSCTACALARRAPEITPYFDTLYQYTYATVAPVTTNGGSATIISNSTVIQRGYWGSHGYTNYPYGFHYTWRVDTFGNNHDTRTHLAVLAQDGTARRNTFFVSEQNGLVCALGVPEIEALGLNFTWFTEDSSKQYEGTELVSTPFSNVDLLCEKWYTYNPLAAGIRYTIWLANRTEARHPNSPYSFPVRYTVEFMQDSQLAFGNGSSSYLHMFSYENVQILSPTEAASNSPIFETPGICYTAPGGSGGGNSGDKPNTPGWLWITVACGVSVIVGLLVGFVVGRRKGLIRARYTRMRGDNYSGVENNTSQSLLQVI